MYSPIYCPAEMRARIIRGIARSRGFFYNVYIFLGIYVIGVICPPDLTPWWFWYGRYLGTRMYCPCAQLSETHRFMEMAPRVYRPISSVVS